MEDWKERLKAEYAQTKERYEKLKAYNTKQEVETRISTYSNISRKDRYRLDLMMHQEETVKARLEAYHKQTQPLIDYYNNKGILKEVDGTKDMNDVFADIVNILG